MRRPTARRKRIADKGRTQGDGRTHVHKGSRDRRRLARPRFQPDVRHDARDDDGQRGGHRDLAPSFSVRADEGSKERGHVVGKRTIEEERRTTQSGVRPVQPTRIQVASPRAGRRSCSTTADESTHPGWGRSRSTAPAASGMRRTTRALRRVIAHRSPALLVAPRWLASSQGRWGVKEVSHSEAGEICCLRPSCLIEQLIPRRARGGTG